MEKVNWKVEGMTCSNCALSVNKVLQRQGMQQISVNPISGEVIFETEKPGDSLVKAREHIELLGYKVQDEHQQAAPPQRNFFKNHLQRFLFCLPFAAILMFAHLAMNLQIHWLHDPMLQLALCLPVFMLGMSYFGESAIKSLRTGIPNMNVLIALGSLAAFVYSTIGLVTRDPSKIFFETAASIITLVFLGEYLEQYTVKKTQETINKLTRREKVMANMLTYDDEHNEHLFPVEANTLKVGDLLLIRSGEEAPADCKILSGEAEVNEAVLTGESAPLVKKQNDVLIGGSVLVSGNLKVYVTAAGEQTVMSGIVQMMKQAQNQKPPVQQLADRISAIFVPAVIGISLLALVINLLTGHVFQESLIRSIAVLVISCPCAMGLATPAALAVGLGRAAKEGILFADTKSLELFKSIRQVVFDKTGTLTNGRFVITAFHSNIDETVFKKIVYSLEKMSNHPIARSISDEWKGAGTLRLKKIEEIKGLGVVAEDREGNKFSIGSGKLVSEDYETGHHLYVLQNGNVIGWIDIADEIRPEAKDVISYCRSKGIKTILLSGDTKTKTDLVAKQLGIDEVWAEQTPQQKLERIDVLVKETPTMMVGDGINDAPALARATVSISLSQASHLAIQSASVVLMNDGLKKLPMAIELGKKTYGTVQSNLGWAFLYNIVALPVAAVGLLTPTAGALLMGMSDVVLALNSLWLRRKRLL